MNVQSYLKRIKYDGPTEATATNLFKIHEAHMLSVPFENLDIHLGRPIILDEERVFDKIVMQRRGGFCYELNRMQAWLLENLGFSVTMLASRSVNSDDSLGIEYDHLMLLVKCPADPEPDSAIPWLADVGWGDGFILPKRLDQPGTEQADGEHRTHIINEVENGFFILSQKWNDEEWEKQYRFDLQPHAYSEYESACHHHQTSPESHFPKKRVCTLATEFGRVTLSEENFTETINGVTSKRPLESGEFSSLLSSKFDIQLADPQWK